MRPHLDVRTEHFRIIHVFYDSPYRCICLVLLYTYIRVDCNAGFDGMPEAVFYYGIGDTYLCCELGKGFTGGIIGEPALIDIQFSGEQPEALVDIALHVFICISVAEVQMAALVFILAYYVGGFWTYAYLYFPVPSFMAAAFWRI